MQVFLKLSDEEFSKAYQALRKIKGGFERAVANAANRSLTAAQTELTRKTVEKYYVKQSEVRKSFTIKKGHGVNYHGALISKGKRKNLTQYKLTPMNNRAGIKKGFKGAVKREGGLKPLPEKSFLINTYNPDWLLFHRIRPGHYWSSIKHVTSPAIPQIVKNEKTVKIASERAKQVFKERLRHETLRLLGAFK